MKLLFETVPGVRAIESDVKNAANTEEVDIVFWNQPNPRGLYFLGVPFLSECKNWARKVSGQEIVIFANTMRGRCVRDGVLVAAQGITGKPGELYEAHYEIAEAARAGQRILVLTRAEIEAFNSYRDLVNQLERRVMEITVRGTKMT